ncbi:CRE-GST-13 protein [Aphelenchoides besseyi]|nr:CRE-GST-13 protein [Aphelenchoides besseyi]
MSKPSYRITYFQARGLAEMSRMDERLDAQTMDSRREEFPYGRLPVLVIDGKTTLAESCAIARYLAKKFGLAGKDDIEACIVDGVADVQKDIGAACSSFFAVASGRQQGDKEQLKQSVLIPTLSKFLPLLQKQLEASGSGFYATSGPTWVDFFVASSVLTLQNVQPDVLEKYKFALEHMERVHSLPQLKDYLAKRPETLFGKFEQSMKKFMSLYAKLLVNRFWSNVSRFFRFQLLKNVEPKVIREYPFALEFIEMALQYKLHYFAIRSRGEPIRLMFTYRGVPFENH